MPPEFIAISIVILLFSVILHEVMHGYVALRFGDRTAENAGRLTLNPIPHIDLFGTILLPLLLFLTNSPFLFGWAKPVPVNPLNFSNIKKGELAVSLAGVGANIFLALLSTTLYHILSIVSPQHFLMAVLNYTVNINLILAVFNLFPIPPLDGSKVLMTMLPFNLARQFQQLERYGFLILILMLMIPFGNGSLLGSILSLIVGFLKMLLGF